MECFRFCKLYTQRVEIIINFEMAAKMQLLNVNGWCTGWGEYDRGGGKVLDTSGSNRLSAHYCYNSKHQHWGHSLYHPKHHRQHCLL